LCAWDEEEARAVGIADLDVIDGSRLLRRKIGGLRADHDGERRRGTEEKALYELHSYLQCEKPAEDGAPPAWPQGLMAGAETYRDTMYLLSCYDIKRALKTALAG